MQLRHAFTFTARLNAQRHPQRLLRRSLTVMLCVMSALCVYPSLTLNAAGPADLTARSRYPMGDAIVDADALLHARRITTWQDGADHVLLLEDDVRLEVGTYGFIARRAVARIETEQQPGLKIHRIMLYLDEARPLRGRGMVTADGPRLLVTVATTGTVSIKTDLLQQQVVGEDELVVSGLARIERYRDAVSAPPMDLRADEPLISDAAMQLRDARRAQIAQANRQRLTSYLPAEALQPQTPAETGVTPTHTPAPSPRPSPVGPGPTLAPETPASAPAGPEVVMVPEDQPQTLPPPQTQVFFSADKIVFEQHDTEDVIVLVGNVRVAQQHIDPARSITLTADHAVLFMPKGQVSDAAAGEGSTTTEIHGVYLEDNVVVTSGDFTVRGPRVYFDVKTNKAMLLDAVLYTWDTRRHIPLYVRAAKIKQESNNSWSAERAIITTSEFAEPHVAVGASRLTIRGEKLADGTSRQVFTAKHTTLRAFDVPFFYLPYLAGTNQELPLRNVAFNVSSNNGFELLTQWDMFALTGQQAPQGVRLDGMIDYRGKHGVGLGLDLDYQFPEFFGEMRGYVLPSDDGEDDIARRMDIEHDGETRGYGLLRHRHYLSNNWEVSLELSKVSDETFLEEFFRNDAETSKDYESLVYVKKQEHDWAFTFLASYNLNEFTPQTTTLQSPGYLVDKLPELGLYNIAMSLWDDRLTYYGEHRLSRMKIRPGSDSPADRGFTDTLSDIVFDIPVATTTFDSVLSGMGFPDDYRNRFDSRNELQAPMKLATELADINIVPYVVGRITAYDEDFSAYSGEDENVRLWGAVGMRMHTQFSRVYENVDNRVLNLHQLRHIIEPNFDISLAATNLDMEDLPLFDTDVEGINKGTTTRVGMRNTLQTKRGGPGRWRSVDWFVLNTDFVHRSDDVDTMTEIARFFDYRPEYSRGGNHFHTELLWQISDNFAAVGEVLYSFENNEVAQWRIGATMRQTPRLSWQVSYYHIDELSSQLLRIGVLYQLTKKYTAGITQTIDFGQSDSRTTTLTLERRLPRWRLLLVASHDDIDDDQSIGIMFTPEGLGNRVLSPAGIGTR